MIGGGPNSVASGLHYPPKAKANQTQAAVAFYCEVGTNGKPDHIQVMAAKNAGQFTQVVDAALHKGMFQPATASGHPVPVVLGGTVLFMFRGNQPTVAVSLSTADKEKTASLGNYIQPQMISTSVEFRRRIFKSRYDSDIHLVGGPHPGAEVLAQVDAQGNLVSTKILAESPPDHGFGPLALKGFKGVKFIPALRNGSPVAGEFNLPIDFEYMKDPDHGAPIGSLLKDDR
jgi:TonB family protein